MNFINRLKSKNQKFYIRSQTMPTNTDNLNDIGYILYELINSDDANLTEVNSSFALRRLKIKYKTRQQSKIYSSSDNEHFIYIEDLDKWYFNNLLFNNQDIQVKLYDTIEDMENIEETKETTDEKEEIPDNMVLFGYIVYKIINYNYISCTHYKSKLLLEKDNISDKKNHINPIYKHVECENVYYIKNMDKWFFESKLNNAEFLSVKLYDSFEDIPLNDYIEKEKNEIKIKETIYNAKSFKTADLHRLNRKALHKDLSFLGYMLLEFTSINHIKYKLYDKREDAEKDYTEYNQITKCFKKRNDENIIYIKLVNGWINAKDSTGKIYETDTDIPLIKENNKDTDVKIKSNSLLKSIFKNRKLIPGGWIYFEMIDDKHILARHYQSSNQLLTRLDDGGNDSAYYKSKLKKACFIKKINKWYYYDENLEKEDVKLEIFNEEEIFTE